MKRHSDMIYPEFYSSDKEKEDLLKLALLEEPVIEELNSGNELNEEFYEEAQKEIDIEDNINRPPKGTFEEWCTACHTSRWVYPNQLFCPCCGVPYLREEYND